MHYFYFCCIACCIAIGCEEALEDGLGVGKIAPKMTTDIVPLPRVHMVERRKSEGTTRREAEKNCIQSNTSSLFDSNNTWPPSTKDSPNSNEYLSNSSNSSLTYLFHSKEQKEPK